MCVCLFFFWGGGGAVALLVCISHDYEGTHVCGTAQRCAETVHARSQLHDLHVR